jgi:hypothetical protein
MQQGLRTCPLGHECHKCLWQVSLRGQNPQTGAETDMEQCALPALALLMVDNSRQQHQTSAAVESFRNEMVVGNKEASMQLRNTLWQMVQDAEKEGRKRLIEVPLVGPARERLVEM